MDVSKVVFTSLAKPSVVVCCFVIIIATSLAPVAVLRVHKSVRTAVFTVPVRRNAAHPALHVKSPAGGDAVITNARKNVVKNVTEKGAMSSAGN